MAHLHSVYDTDAHFKIDAVTRAIKNDSSGKTVLIQGDHNSERFTFEVPRMVDGHDLSLCNRVQVHYINIDSTDKTKVSKDLHDLDDLQISPESDDVVICSWQIDGKATVYAGSLNFLLKFKCVSADGTVDYVWNTAIFTGISVSSGIDNGEAIAEDYSDVLEQWRKELIDTGGVTDERIEAAVASYLAEYPIEAGSSVYIGTVQPTDGTIYWLDTSDSGGVASEYSITTNLTNATIDNAAKTLTEGESYAATITPDGGYVLDSVKITMGGKNITGMNYSDGNIYIASVTGNIVITVSARELPEDEKVYTITNSLVNVTSNNSAVSVPGNSTYTATLTAADGYTLDAVTVTMGGVNVTDSVYAVGVITIPAVTGNVMITATSVEGVWEEITLTDKLPGTAWTVYSDDGATKIGNVSGNSCCYSATFDEDTEVKIEVTWTGSLYSAAFIGSASGVGGNLLYAKSLPEPGGNGYYEPGEVCEETVTVKAGYMFAVAAFASNSANIKVWKKG